VNSGCEGLIHLVQALGIGLERGYILALYRSPSIPKSSVLPS
jgi:hypothetical protein